jgi:SAM-dependent methyltransferase
MANGVESKAWDWEQQEGMWLRPSDEFQPVAKRWQERGWKRVADLGCGLGRHSLLLASLGFDVVSVDLSPRGLNRLETDAKRMGLAGRIRAIECDLVRLPEDLGQFDGVLSFHALYHTDYAGLESAVSWVTRHVDKGGGLYATFNSKANASYRAPEHRRIDDHTIVKESGPESGIPHTYLAYEEIVRLLEGYQLARVQQIEDFYEGGKSSIHFFVEAYRA